jgi:hypothetical protein
MKIAYYIQEKKDDEWIDRKELGLFASIDVANEKIYFTIENKGEFWTHYKVVQFFI